MSLTVGARDNTLAGSGKAVRYHTRHAEIIGYDRLIDIMAASRTTLTKPDLVAAVELITETVADLVADGKFVKMPLGDYYMTAVGCSDTAGQHFTPRLKSSGHGFRLRFRPDRTIEKDIAAKVKVKRDDSSATRLPSPEYLKPIRELNDPSSIGDTRDGTVIVARGDFARLYGSLLGFDPADERLGVFLEPRWIKGVTRAVPAIRCAVYAGVKPSLVLFQIPRGCEGGDYTVTVITATRAGSLRTGRMQGIVRVG